MSTAIDTGLKPRAIEGKPARAGWVSRLVRSAAILAGLMMGFVAASPAWSQEPADPHRSKSPEASGRDAEAYESLERRRRWQRQTLGPQDPQRGASLVVEDALRRILADWGSGSATAAVDLSGWQQRVIDRKTGFAVDDESLDHLPLLDQRQAMPEFKAPPGGKTAGFAASGLFQLPGLGCLRKVEDHTLGALAELEPESLLPLSYLYLAVYVEQSGHDGRPWLAGRNRQRFRSLLDLYVDRAADPPAARGHAALVLIRLAEHLWSRGAYNLGLEAKSVFYEALKLDPDNLEARYWAAFLEEKYGDYPAALVHLRRLARARPGDPEVELRLGVNLGRTGKPRAATAALEAVARGDASDWMRIVAYQELARLVGEKRGDVAVAYLREALRRFPDEPQLTFQLAYRLRRDWRGSAALVERVEAGWHGDSEDSPRVTYEYGRTDDLAAAKKRLGRELSLRLESVTRGLARLEELERRSRAAGRSRPVFQHCYGVLPLDGPPAGE